MAIPPRRRSRSRSTRAAAPKFTLAPRRLEPRRMLDGAAAAMALETVAVGAAFTPSSDKAAAAAPPVANLNGNTAPSNIDIQTPIVINENGVATLALTFDDPDAGDTHTIFVDWKDGSTQTFNLAAGQTSFSTTHQYLDDNLPGPATEDYDVLVRVTDSAGEFSQVTSKITVNNVAPSNLQLAPITPINENGIATLKLTFDDPGSQDTHTVEVNWGDGSPVQVYNVPTGDRSFTATHQYLDDNPTATPSDNYTVSVRLVDDDLGVTTATTTATVNNVAPSNVKVTPVASILAEGGQASLNVTFDDPGSQDTHQVEINWGDGNTTVTTAVGHALNVNHTYGDNATYAIIVKVIDDDGGAGFGSAAAFVSNVPPSNVKIDPIATIDENGVAVLKLTFDDPGTLDSHTVDVDWGDGTIETIAVAAGSRTLTATHQYLDDNPTGTSSDVYAVKVTVRDDDGGSATGNANVQVVNVPPSNVKVTPVANIVNEGSQVALTVTFDDAGSQDTHQVEINWGDGNTTVTNAVGHSLNVNHTYGDNGTYAITVKVIDDDGGVGFGSAAALVNNVPPSNVKIDPIAAIDENGVATLTLTFDDPGSLDSHTVEIDWGDGMIETVAVAAGSRTLTATHQYLDDNPTGTSSDVYTVKATVRDDDGGQAVGNATVQVSNVAPSNVKIDPIVAIDENGVAALTLTFDDPGSLDTHTVDIDWGDGTIETVAVAAGSRTLTATHQYLDDNPTSTSFDVYTVKATVRDDDGGQAVGNATVQVSNVPPSNVKIDPIVAINENGVATLTLAFDDPGTLDSHTVDIDWGDGTIETIAAAAGSRTLTATHQYLDDNPTGTASDVYTVKATVRDDDGGQAVGSATVQVNNVAPGNVVATPVASIITEGSQVSLDITFDDVGSQDTHQVEITWGDGYVTVGTATGHTFSASHTYADNGTYAVYVKVIDDDGGVGNGSAAVHVNNVAPTLTVPGSQTVNEGGVLSLPNIGQFTDPGFNNPLNAGNVLNGGETTEEFTYEINWGDGSANSTGAATIDQLGGVGTPTAGSFDGSHVYADNGVYTVTVTVRDDDGGVTTSTFQVTVLNVDPSLTFQNPTIVVNEGAPITLGGIGVGVTDPGFDNGAQGTQETFHDATVDWGDGTAPQSLTINNRVSGSPGVATTADFVSAPHVYADNGTYTVTVRFRDDDGGFVDRTFTITVENVAPSLNLTNGVFVIDEGQTLNLPNLGTFSDPGFNNPNNPNGASVESFHYTINWGDGTTESGQLPASVVNGSAGNATIGTLASSHKYADNDADNKYTITVTLFDDDGGSVTKEIEVTVRNVNPTLKPLVATDVNNKGETTLTLQFTDPGADSFNVQVDWGDGTISTYPVDVAGNGQTHVFTHKYSGPPDPLNPTGDITLTVQVFDDDFGTPGVVAIGASNVETIDISQPGLGAEKFRIDTSPQVAILTFPDRQVVPLLPTAADARLATVVTTDDGGGGGDTRAASERYLELCVINPDGTPGQRFRLPSNVLNNLPALFKNLPDNHYVIYLVQSETNARRLVIDVFVRNGKLIDPGDDSEGARDRPPTEEATTQPAEEQPAAVPAAAGGDEGAGVEAPATLEPLADLGVRPRSSTAIYHGATLAGVAIALSGAGKSSYQQMEEAIARAKPDQWKRLRSALSRPKKPR